MYIDCSVGSGVAKFDLRLRIAEMEVMTGRDIGPLVAGKRCTALSCFAQGYPSTSNTIDNGNNRVVDPFKQRHRGLFVAASLLISVCHFANVSHVSSILQTFMKRHAPPIARIVEPLQILLA